MELAAEGLSIVLSSHLIDDLERVCDYLIVLAHGRARLAGDIEDIVGDHHVITCPRLEPGRSAGCDVIARSDTARQTTLLVRGELPALAPNWTVASVGLEEIVLAYMAQQEPEPATVHSIGGAA
jgi:ABC-2 type transport system ATP-binding protein